MSVRTVGLGCVVVTVVFLLIVGGVIVGTINWFGSEAVQVAKEEFNPRELLRKYSWFKNAAASLDAKVASLDCMGQKIKTLENAYEGQARRNWDRTDLETWSQWSAERDGVAMSYNNLAAEYNANMAKEQWRFCEAGRLPAGADVPLPREFKPYITK
jgi:hypothetical protein